MIVQEIRTWLLKLGNKQRATDSQRYFKTGPGEYGEGNIFLGIRVPELRKLAKEYQSITPTEATRLLRSPIHEERLLALLILVRAFSRGNGLIKEKVFNLYLQNTRYINNWDLVDASAAHIVGAFLMDKDKKPLYDLAQSKDLWERRIAIIATFYKNIPEYPSALLRG